VPRSSNATTMHFVRSVPHAQRRAARLPSAPFMMKAVLPSNSCLHTVTCDAIQQAFLAAAQQDAARMPCYVAIARYAHGQPVLLRRAAFSRLCARLQQREHRSAEDVTSQDEAMPYCVQVCDGFVAPCLGPCTWQKLCTDSVCGSHTHAR
jgi:hypothetical protein